MCLWPYPRRPPSEFTTLCQECSFEPAYGATKFLGGVVGLHVQENIIQDLWYQCEKEIDNLMNDNIPLQHFYILLRTCVSKQPCYLTRVINPELAAPYIQRYQHRLLQAIATRTGFKTDHLTPSKHTQLVTQLGLPVKLGGFGISILLDTYPSNYAASICASIPLLHGDLATSPLLDHVLTIAKYIHENWQHDLNVKELLNKVLPTNIPSLLLTHQHGNAKKLQHTLTDCIHLCLYDLWLPHASSNSDRIRITMLRSPYTANWLLALPTSPTSRLRDPPMRLAVLLRLGLPPEPDPPPGHCRLCGIPTSNGHWHRMCCEGDADYRFFSDQRHNNIRDDLYHAAREYSIPADWEPNVYKQVNGKHEARADLFLVLRSNSPDLWDITVNHPIANSFLRHSSNPLTILEEAACVKRKRHTSRSKLINCHFRPFVVTTFGSLHVEACNALRGFARRCADACTWEDPEETYKKVFKDLITRMQMQVIRGNSNIMHHPHPRPKMRKW